MGRVRWRGSASNCVRLHFLDLDAPRGLIDRRGPTAAASTPQQLDRLDFFIAELKKRGIYINLNLNVGRSYKSWRRRARLTIGSAGARGSRCSIRA